MEPLFTCVSNNAHHLYTLLSCIGFASKATVQITPDGLRFSAEEARVIQGLAFLDKSLFSSYTFNPTTNPNNQESNEDEDSSDNIVYPHFVVSLTALLETLKIFGINDLNEPNGIRDTNLSQTNPASSAFSAPTLLMDRSCTLQYAQHGSPLSIAITESGVKTTCELVTYEPENETDIPLQRDAIIMKIIMRSAWLHNAIAELDSSTPTILKLSACATREPYFALSGAGGPFSESTVEFSVDQHNEIVGGPSQAATAALSQSHKVLTDDGSSRARATRSKLAPTVTETFLVSPPSSMGERIRQNYRFALIRKAARAMSVANKVSIRGDRQGVLSLQFMIELDDHSTVGRPVGAGVKAAGPVCFVDFRFVPLLDEEDAEMDAPLDSL